MESGKHKKRVSYTVMIVSDSPYGGSHPFYLKQGLLTTIFGLIAVILTVSIGAAVYHWSALRKVTGREEELQAQIEELTQQNQELTTDNAELSDKVAILSDTVTQNAETQKAQEEEEEAKRIPNDFPLAGAAVILKSSEITAETGGEANAEGEAAEGEEGGTDAQIMAEQDPIVVFSASAGTKVIAAADGVVASVEDDPLYGYKVTIDHQNGYTSIYRSASSPAVTAGEEVELGATLYEMQSPDEKFGYQITQEGTLIDPLDLLEVYG